MKPYATVGIRNRTMMESYGLLESYCRPIVGSMCMIEKAFEAGEGFSARTCHHIQDRTRLRRLMEKEVRAGVYSQEFFDAIDKTYKDTVQDIKTFWKNDFSNVSNEVLIEYFDRYYQIYITTLHPMVVAIYASDLQEFFEDELQKVVGDITQEEVLEYTALLLTPTRLTTVQKEEQILFALQNIFEKKYPEKTEEQYKVFIGEPETSKVFAELERLYGWFHMEYIGEPRTKKEYEKSLWNRIKELKEEKIEWKDQTSPKDRLQAIVAEQQQFFTNFSNTGLLKQIAFAMQEFLIVLDYSKADLVEGIYYAQPLLTEIAKRVGLDWITVRYLLPDEIKESLHKGKKISVEFIKDRKDHFALILENKTIATFYGREAKEKTDEVLQKDEVENIKEFRGLTAYPGKVTGIAIIVTSAKDRDKFKRGCILVTRDTTTELTSIIKKSIAIVADQGSLLSHTAIVSREFKIPCLVLTKIATKVIKDGDTIEVDASNGVVRIISSKV